MKGHVVYLVGKARDLPTAAARRIHQRAEEAVIARGRFVLALAGGSTPRPVYHELAREPWVSRMPWDLTTLVFGDEHCVPPDEPAPNFNLVKESLLDRLPTAAAPTVLRIEAGRRDAAEAYARRFVDLGRIDLALLGCGADGHTAGLAPDRGPGPASLESDHPVCMAARTSHEGWEPPDRITLTYHALRSARNRLFLVTGESKAWVVAEALWEDTTLPAGRVGPSEWLLAPADAYAAALGERA